VWGEAGKVGGENRGNRTAGQGGTGGQEEKRSAAKLR
jgi:hypothetical protein